MFVFRILIFKTLLLSSFNMSAGVLDFFKSNYKALDYKYSSQEEYEFDACQKFNADESNSYYLTCHDGELVKESDFNQLLYDMRAIEHDVVENSLLKDLQKEVLAELKKNREALSQQHFCIKKIKENKELTEGCKALKEVIYNKVTVETPKLRLLMAQKEFPGKVYSSEKPRRFKTENFQHDVTKINAPDLTTSEIEFLENSTNVLEEAFTQDVLAHNFTTKLKGKGSFLETSLTCGPKDNSEKCKLQEQRFSTIPDSKKCILKAAENSYKIKKTMDCQYLKLQVSTIVNHKFKNQNAVYKEEYENKILKDPLLASIELTGEESNNEIFLSIDKTFQKLLDSTDKAINRIEGLSGEDRVELLGFNVAVEKFLKDRGPTQVLCDVSTELKSDRDFDEMKVDLYIGAAAMIGGGVCIFSGGLGCAVGFGLGVGLEGVAIGISNSKFSKAQTEYLAGITDANTIGEREFERDLGMYLAPLALVGGPGRLVIDEATQTLKSTGRRINPLLKKEKEFTKKEISSDRRNGSAREGGYKSRRSDLEYREQFQGVIDEAGGKDEISKTFKKYYPNNRRNLEHKDQIYLAALAKKIEDSLLREMRIRNPEMSEEEIIKRVHKKTFKVIDDVAQTCTKK